MKVSIVGSLRDREVACSASARQGSNFESYVWRTVSSQSSHHPQEVLLAQFSLYVHKGGLKPDSFHYSLLLACKNIALVFKVSWLLQHCFAFLLPTSLAPPALLLLLFTSSLTPPKLLPWRLTASLVTPALLLLLLTTKLAPAALLLLLLTASCIDGEISTYMSIT